jgi:hypothetical protein
MEEQRMAEYKTTFCNEQQTKDGYGPCTQPITCDQEKQTNMKVSKKTDELHSMQFLL